MDAMEQVKKQAFQFGRYVADHWITVIILLVSSTQTYFRVSMFAPAWAVWLPALGVCLMEGGFLYWRWREYEADPLEDGKTNTNKQEQIANWMVYLTLFAVALTMLAGATIEIAKSDLAYILTIPNMENVLGLSAVFAIFILAVCHMFADWQYRRNDPDASKERYFREQTRQLDRQRREAENEGKRIVMQGRNDELKRLYDERGRGIGRTQAADEFEAIANKANPTNGKRLQ